MNSKRKWALDSIHLSRLLLQEQIWPLLAIFAFSCFINVSIEDAMQLATPADDTQRWVMQLGLGIWDLLEGILMLLILSFGIPKVRVNGPLEFIAEPFASPYLGSFLAEYLRVLAQVLMWGLLLIVPGFIRYCRLIFVPFIALFAKSYRLGAEDALRLSEKLSSGRLTSIYLALGITMGLELFVEFLPQMVPVLHILGLRVLFAAVSFLISIWTYSLIYLMFESVIHEITTAE